MDNCYQCNQWVTTITRVVRDGHVFHQGCVKNYERDLWKQTLTEHRDEKEYFDSPTSD